MQLLKQTSPDDFHEKVNVVHFVFVGCLLLYICRSYAKCEYGKYMDYIAIHCMGGLFKDI